MIYHESLIPNFNLSSPGRVRNIVKVQSLQYRVRIARFSNYFRLLAVAMFIVAISVSADQSFNIREIAVHAPQPEHILSVIFAFCYVAMLLVCNTALKRVHPRAIFLLINAVLDVFFLLLLLISYHNTQWSQTLIAIYLSSILLSVLSLSVRQSAVFAIFNVLMIMGLLLLAMFCQQIDSDIMRFFNQFPSTVRRILELDNGYDLLWPLFQISIFALVLFLIGYYSAQAQDNRIQIELNRNLLENLHKLNNSIIEEMDSGLIVVDPRSTIVIINKKAKHIFQHIYEEQNLSPIKLTELSERLNLRYLKWIHLQLLDFEILTVGANSYTIHFASIGSGNTSGLTLITLEDVEAHYRRVRETRLASLGRLTAGIAHEIRNPLGSVQNAADLLLEQHNDLQTRFLIGKMLRNTKRINSIISEIMRLFHNKPHETKLFHLNPFIYRLMLDAKENEELLGVEIIANIAATVDYAVYFSPGSLNEILYNLMLNAAKHNPDQLDLTITFRTSISKNGHHLFFDVIDNGTGVEAEDEEKIFEPFFSKRSGTGLGLYLVREMCIANNAQIVYLRGEKGAHFRITMERYANNENNNQPMENR
ncbi:ATP-binding protein [Suttonella sp. R2A3]|uniref:ATP-binding protein n=1 Tax=Suttonella sp. R2A3 TaxID=2908648 RepID=UPI001F169681|nr:ATP-binding protein [Suttonella sp. R2A3]UJF24859.1 ATP-binding protein [Suttonella sp. R2A3]